MKDCTVDDFFSKKGSKITTLLSILILTPVVVQVFINFTSGILCEQPRQGSNGYIKELSIIKYRIAPNFCRSKFSSNSSEILLDEIFVPLGQYAKMKNFIDEN